jgi:DNA-binding HxlR family transcriptional regulator
MNASKKPRGRVPKVGVAVRGSNTGRPIMVALDLLGRRTALRILWELRDGPLTFRALQEACETTPGLLNTRLKELRATDIVTHADGGYQLTPQGRKLRTALNPLSAWAQAWAEASVGGRAQD